MTPAIAPAATRARYVVLAFGVALAAVTYLDRVCISVTAKHIMRDLSLSELQMLETKLRDSLEEVRAARQRLEG